MVVGSKNGFLESTPLTTNGSLYADANGLVQSTAAGTTGTFLGGNTGSAPTFQSMPASSITIAGDSGSTTGSSFTFTGGTSGANFSMSAGTMTESFNFLALPNTTSSSPVGTITLNSQPYFSNYGTGGGASNIFVGSNSGNLTMTVGTAVRNSGLGTTVLVGLTTGNNNTAIGDQSSQSFTTGSFNTAIGSGTLNAIVSGSNNTAVGYLAGSNHGLADASNIDIGNIGASGSNAIRIGTQGSGAGQQNRCFIAGITGVTTSNSNIVSFDTTTGQLGALAIPLTVPNGGTGVATLTSHGVLIGQGTSAIAATSAGTTGQLFIGTTGADPAFGSSASADFTFTSATAGTTRTLTVSNTDNTNATSNALILETVGGSSAGDPFQTFTITGAASWSVGADNSDSDKFKVSASTALGTTDVTTSTTSGEINYPLQPAFLSSNSADDTNATGDGTSFTIICNTEIYDQNSDYNNATGVFTAPVTGRYHFAGSVGYSNIGVLHTTLLLDLVGSNRTIRLCENSPTAMRSAANTLQLSYSTYLDMDAGDTATLTTLISGSTKTVTIRGTVGAIELTTFGGKLVA